MKEKPTNKYAFSLAEKKKIKVLRGGELDFDNMNKGFYDEIISKDGKIKYLKNSLEKTKNWTIKESVYSNVEVPQIWKNKMSYPNEVLNTISKDNNFFNYLTKVNINTSDYNRLKKKEKSKLEEKETENLLQVNKEEKPAKEIKINFENEIKPINPLSINGRSSSPGYIRDTKSNFFSSIVIEDRESEDLSSRRRLSISKKRTWGTLRKEICRVFTEKEKREILDNYREMFPEKKNVNDVFSPASHPKLPNVEIQKKNSTLIKANTTYPGSNSDLNSTQKTQMFKSSIYSLLIPNKFSNRSINESEKDNNSNMRNPYTNYTNMSRNLSNNNQNLASKKVSSSQTEYGPFLHFNYAEYNKKIEIKNPEVKKVLEDIEYFGPYFSHCPSCRNKNLEFYQTMEPHYCLNILNYLKKTRKKNKANPSPQRRKE